ncbi:Predicted ester cyclase [Streptococcus pneumoniae]|jgi:predicted ester cyclase|uniref:Ester cyclase n=1 Tax=Stutzerimonas stutzeri TaxID=316 RepID=A0AA42H9B3_STUST|nr:ester cyclase [Stutzerimonas stutzeri]CJL69030.1 Predicted ester cyclase [Streptococcus pneumoniae]HAG17848.1 ester cyclase [Pseudomonas sp.]AVX14618.1 ester cyclase [Stutzerimonas stutzeri]MBS9724128.1 ester cyclase [Stutzerimonas stutzeri]MDH0102630.1 ester cyclase [Stutzerimonas stutzeri]
MNKTDLAERYRGYIACLNEQDWPGLGTFVHDEVHYNGQRVGLAGYRAMLENDFRTISDLRFDVQQLIVDPPQVACRLQFDCTPTGILFDLPVNGRRVREVWSVIDKAAIAAQIG